MSIDQSVTGMPEGVSGSMPLTTKAIMIGVLAVVLAVPLFLIYSTVAERQQRYSEAVREIGNVWGLPQQIGGPRLVIPYAPDDKSPSSAWRNGVTLLPDSLRIDATVVPETRYRGLFEAVVYVLDVEMAGEFVVPAFDDLATRGRLDWPAASLRLNVSDARNLIVAPGDAQLGGRSLNLEPAGPSGNYSAQLKAEAGPDLAPGTRVPFRFKLRLNGSEGLSFLPLGKNTTIDVKAPWSSPSFFGAFLPADRSIDGKTFDARWQVSYLGRGFPQYWTVDNDNGVQEAITRASFGVNFLQTVSPYRETERAIKYGILFVALTFVIYLLFEIASGQPIHLLQYGAVGLAMCVFYLLLLSLSEQLGFGAAYAISAAAVVGQTSAYTYATTRRMRYALTFGALLGGLYAFLYVLMQMESYSLMSGSVALFLALSALMYLTRNLNRQGLPSARA